MSAPGRVNLIGDHTDYTGGWVFPAALGTQTALAYRRNEGGGVEAHSENETDAAHFEVGQEGVKGWGGYLAGVSWALSEAGYTLPGLQLAVASDVPTGSGLSSSAALEVAAARAWGAAGGIDFDRVQVAKLCRRAENHYVGVPSGIMDQFASSVPEPAQAILLDCSSLDYEILSSPEGWRFAVVDSGASRQLAGSAYAERVAECERITDILGLESLRELQTDDLRNLHDNLLKRARHIYHENRRVLEAADALRAGNLVAFGSLMTESHVSLRDDYEVSSDALDRLVETSLVFEECYGSRLTGAGFGGCTVSLIGGGHEEAFRKHLAERIPSARVVTFI